MDLHQKLLKIFQKNYEEDLNKLNENTVLIGILNPYENKKYFNIEIDRHLTLPPYKQYK